MNVAQSSCQSPWAIDTEGSLPVEELSAQAEISAQPESPAVADAIATQEELLKQRHHPLDALTDLFLATLLATKRVEPGRAAMRAAVYLTAASCLRYPHVLFKGTAKITGSTLRRERKRVLRWVRENRPDLVARANKFLTESEEDSESSPKPPT